MSVPFVSSIRLVPELLTIPTRIRLPINHQTRMTENALEFTADVPAGLDDAERERTDFLYAIVEAGREPSSIKGYTMERSEWQPNEWLRSLDPLHAGDKELAYVKYTPRIRTSAVSTTTAAVLMNPARSVQPA